MTQRKYLGLRSLDELAMAYAMTTRPGYQSGNFADDSLEIELSHLRQEMTSRFTPYEVQQAIKKADITLEMIAYHEE